MPDSRFVFRALKRARSSMLKPPALLSLLLLVAVSLSPMTRAAIQTASTNTSTTNNSKRAEAEYVPGEVLVRFRSEETVVGGEESVPMPLLARGTGREIQASIEKFDGAEMVRGLRLARVPAEDTLKAVEALKARADVLYAEPNYIWHKTNTPNDASYGDLWGLKNTGQTGNNDQSPTQPAPQPGTPGADIKAEQAWNTTTGSRSVVVGVVDEGIDINHPDLQPNIWVNPGEVAGNGIDDDGNGFVDDVNGWDFNSNDRTVYDGAPTNDIDSHGTHVAGTIGARGNNGVGVAGVNWQVSLMSLKVLGVGGGSTVNIIKAYAYARMMREQHGINIRVLNNSYGGSGFSQAAFDAISALNEAGILFVAAAGNDANDSFNFPDYPASYDLPNVIAVAATDRFDQLAVFSNFGARSVSMGAPGRGILSTTPNNTYQFFSGTSMATPHVTGAAALVCASIPGCAGSAAINSGISTEHLRGVIALSGDVIPSLQGKTTTGRRLNVAAAIQSANEGDTTPPATTGDLHVTAQDGRTVTLTWTAPGDDGNFGTAADYDLFFNSSNGARLLLPTTLLPAAAGTTQSATITLPFLNFSGSVELKVYDNAGNFSTASMPVTITQNQGSDPYVITTGGAEALSTGGTPLNLNGDDKLKENQPLPFSFPFYGEAKNVVTISTNGALYFSRVPKDDAGNSLDAGSSIVDLSRFQMIAGLWDDLRTDRGGNVFVVQPDTTRVIYRWEAVTFNTPLSATTSRGEQPVKFEIELSSDGRITLRYGAGQAAPTNTRLFPVVGISGGEPDAYSVASHTSQIALKSLTNAPSVTFTPRPATVTPTPTPVGSNPIDDATFFVTQQYKDFLNRDPDSSGLAFWVNQIESCGSDAACREIKRVNTSGAFFLSIEFQETGFLVHRFHQAAFNTGEHLRLNKFLPDTQAVSRGVVIGQPGALAQLEANKQAFANDFVARPEFLALYPVTMANGQFIETLNANTGGSLSPAESESLINRLNSATINRAQALREVAEDAEFGAREKNRAFVLMQYFGYLRRNPDDAPESTLDFQGYNFWLGKLNEFGGDFVRADMVKAFITSGEYRHRFGP